MAALNKELLLRTMEEIEKFPETHDQGGWFKPLDLPVPSKDGELCNTTFCLAGHAAVLSGASHPEPAEWVAQHGFEERRRSEWLVNPETRESFVCLEFNDVIAAEAAGAIAVQDYAREVLGLEPWEADALFYFYGSRADLRTRVEGIIHDREQRENRASMVTVPALETDVI